MCRLCEKYFGQAPDAPDDEIKEPEIDAAISARTIGFCAGIVSISIVMFMIVLSFKMECHRQNQKIYYRQTAA